MLSRKDLAKEYYNIGNAFYELGKTEEAVEYYRRAIELDRTLLKANYNLARAYIEQKEYDQGIAILDILLKKDPENTMILETLGYACFKKGDFVLAREYYEKVLEVNELDESSLYNLGLLSQAEGKEAEALDYYLRLYKVNPEGNVLKKLGEIYASSGDNEKAIAYYEEYLTKNASDIDANLAVKDLYMNEAYYSKALERLDNLTAQVKESDKLAEFYFEKGRLLIIFIGDYQKGIEALNAAIDNGFRDKQKIGEFLKEVKGDLAQTLKDLFKKRGVYP